MQQKHIRAVNCGCSSAICSHFLKRQECTACRTFHAQQTTITIVLKQLLQLRQRDGNNHRFMGDASSAYRKLYVEQWSESKRQKQDFFLLMSQRIGSRETHKNVTSANNYVFMSQQPPYSRCGCLCCLYTRAWRRKTKSSSRGSLPSRRSTGLEWQLHSWTRLLLHCLPQKGSITRLLFCTCSTWVERLLECSVCAYM